MSEEIMAVIEVTDAHLRVAAFSSGGAQPFEARCMLEESRATDARADWIAQAVMVLARYEATFGGVDAVTVVLPAAEVEASIQKLPPAPAAARPEMIRFLFAEIATGWSDPIWAWSIREAGPAGAEVLVCAASRERVESIVEAFGKHGFAVRSVLPKPAVWADWVQAKPAEAIRDALYAFLEGDALTVISGPEVRIGLRHLRLTAAPVDPGTNSAGISPDEHRWTMVAREIVRTTMAGAKGGGNPVARVHLTAGGIEPLKTAHEVAMRLDLQVTVPAESRLGNREKRGFEDGFIVAVTAMTGQPSQPRADFVTVEMRKKWCKDRRVQTWLALTAASVIALLPALVTTYRQMTAVQVENAMIARACSRQLDLIEKAKEKMKIPELDAWGGRGIPWAALLSDWEQRLVDADGVWIDHFRLVTVKTPRENESRITIAGHALDREHAVERENRGLRDKMKSVVAGLAKSPFVRSVRVERLDWRDPGLLDFEATVALRRSEEVRSP